MSDEIRQRSIQLRDFSGGLNNFWDASSIAANEVPYLLNMDFSPNGALRSRPPIIDSGLGVPVAGQYIDILGYYMPANGTRYLIATTDAKTWALNTAGTTWTEIWAYKATGMVQYADEVVLSKASTGGTRWNGTTSTAISTMPAMDGLTVFRDRMFGWGVNGSANQTSLYFSDIITLAAPTGVYTWDTANNVIEIGRGDGQAITKVIADYSKIIIFKTASTYALSYAGSISTTGQVNLLRAGIGAETAECVVNYSNGHIVLHDQTLYSFINDNFTPLNSQKVVFQTKSASPTYKKNFAVSVLGDSAIVWYFGNIYVLNLLTGTWSQWESTYSQLAMLRVIPPLATEMRTNEIAYGITGSGTSSYWKIYKITNNSVAPSGSETFTCAMRTRIYDFDTPAEWKRLYWWAADIAAAGTVTANMYTIALSGTNSTWDTLSSSTWDTLSTRSWDRMSDENAVVQSVRSIGTASTPQRTSLKLDNSVRFRRIYFEVYLTCDGTAATAPAQIFSITPMIGVKAKMTKAVS